MAAQEKFALQAPRPLTPRIVDEEPLVRSEAQLTRGILGLLGRRPKLLVGERQHRLYPATT